jgi:hypothetical protein
VLVRGRTGALCNACTHLPQTGDRADPRACCKGLEADWARPGRGPFGIQRKALCIRKCSVYCVQDVAARVRLSSQTGITRAGAGRPLV